jgi:hypothetical protein
MGGSDTNYFSLKIKILILLSLSPLPLFVNLDEAMEGRV